MLKKLGSRLSYANVMATIAVFLVLGGAAAIGATSICSGNIPCVNSDDIIDSEVKTPDVADGAVTAAKQGLVPAARVRRITSGQAIANNTTIKLSFQSETFDTANLHSNTVTPTRLTAPIAGLYQVNAGVVWQSATGGGRELWFLSGGVPGAWSQIHSSEATAGPRQTVSDIVSLPAGGFVEALVRQTSGASLMATASASTFMAMTWVGPSS
jgi:hypothetical protein